MAARSPFYRDRTLSSIATSSVHHRRRRLTRSTGAPYRPHPGRILAWRPLDLRDRMPANNNSSNSNIAWHRPNPWRINHLPEDRSLRRDTWNRPARRRHRWGSEASTVVSRSPSCLVWRRIRILR